MAQDKEYEIQMQFLEEATDYIDTLERVLLEIDSTGRIEVEKINGAMRAAHSIKGGAGMMGFRTLSDFAHRLEDSFKVLKTKRYTIDAQVQSLLLSGVDCLRQIVELHGQGYEPSPQWLEQQCNPIFRELHTQLGDPTPEDASTLLSPEDEQDIIPLLFETEVEGCLQRLESVLNDTQQPCLKEEVAIMAAELGGLGEMLQLGAFTDLCGAVARYLEVVEASQVEELARVALDTWRRVQALVLTNQLDQIPRDLDWQGLSLPQIQDDSEHLTTNNFPESVFVEESPLVDDENQSWFDPDLISTDFAALEAAFAEQEETTEFQVELPEFTVEAISTESFANPELSITPVGEVSKTELEESTVVEKVVPQELVAASLPTVDNIASAEYTPVTDLSYQSSQPIKERESAENTVRVSSRQLEQINDLFGELIVQRNGLNLQLERMRKLIRNLSDRVQTLERENQQLRTSYDKIATQAISFQTELSEINPGSGALFSDFHAETSSHGFDSLEMDRYNDLNLLSQEVMETIVQVQEVTTDLQLSLDDTDNIARKLNKTSKQIQRKLTQVRMRPLSDVVDRFPRALRDLGVEYGKSVQLQVEGSSILIERNILEALNDPLMHLLRNAFDHGIEDPQTRRRLGKPEQGLIEIKASHQGNRTVIRVRDDGRGISLDKIRDRALKMGLDASLLAQATDDELLSLIFEPGFTTSEQVTSLSGRGVGMDVVRNNLKNIRGDIKVETVPGKGTTFTLSVPFTLSVARVLLVESNMMLLALPTDVVSEIFLLQPEQVVPMGSGEVIPWQGTTIPLIRLHKYLEFNCPRYDNPNLETSAAINAESVLLIYNNNQPVGLLVDRTWGEQEVAVRVVEGTISLPPGFNNCTILGDGRVVPLVNATELLYAIATQDRTPRNQQLPSAKLQHAFLGAIPNQTKETPKNQKGTILIVDDSINVRRFLALTLEKAGYLVEQAKDGQDAIEKLQNGLQVQAVICDIEMPRVDGYGFLGRVKANTDLRDIPVAMLTSRSSDKHRQLAMQLGARAYFSKPYNEQELVRTLEEIIFPLAGVSK